MLNKELALEIKKLPKTPGVYIFKDAKDKPIYIGKATNLKSRVLAYAKVPISRSRILDRKTIGTTDPRIQKMVDEAQTLTYGDTKTDIEALILESQLIKRHRPNFNIVMRDDKQYFYVGFTKEDFPRIFLTHQPLKPISHKLRPDFVGPFTDGSSLKGTLKFLRRLFPHCTCKQKHHVRCLNAHIGKCLGFCCLKNRKPSKEEKQDYRKNVNAIRSILNGRRIYLVRNLEKEMKALAHNHDFEAAIELKTKIERLKRIFENALIIQSYRKSDPSESLRAVLNLPIALTRIEGYDISNIQGLNATGSMVVFTNGEKDKNEYRKFKIRTLKTSDDTGMLKEVLMRRFSHPEWATPGLLLIDGGKGQLNAAEAALSKLKVQSLKSQVPIVALTKDHRHRGDKIIYKEKGNYQTIRLKDLPEIVRNLILAIDTEAHRFAITYYRKLHRKSLKN